MGATPPIAAGGRGSCVLAQPINFKPGHLVFNKYQKEIMAIFNIFGVVLSHSINVQSSYIMLKSLFVSRECILMRFIKLGIIHTL